MNTAMVYRHPQSTFVSTLSWCLIVFTSIGFICSLTQSFALIWMSHSKPLMPPSWENMPVFTYMLDHFAELVGGICILFLLGLGAAIGLLQRKEWARQASMFLLAVGILLLHAFLIAQWVGVEQLPETVIPDTRWLFFLKISTAAWVVSLSFLAGWIIKRLEEKKSKVIFRTKRLQVVDVSLA